MKPALVSLLAIAIVTPRLGSAADTAQPNIVMIYVDDMGYGDLSLFGATDLHTPNIDSIAESGVKFTNFYNSSSACSTSRAALLTGSYHSRASIHTVFPPGSTHGLHPNEITIAELLNGAGYESAMVGKWHLGHTENMMPWRQGFDRFYGIPVSHDYGSGGPHYSGGVPTYRKEPKQEFTVERVVHKFDLPEVAQYTGRFSEQAVAYIKQRNRSKPLFLYVAQPMPHVTLAVTEEYAGASSRGLYGDVMEALDTGVGMILDTLADEGIRENTIVVFASDNGPWLSFGNHAGDQGGLREGKRTIFDGGVRTPAALSWPAQVVAGQVIDTPAAVMDLFPTFAAIAGTPLPNDRVIDGRDLRSLFLEGSSAKGRNETYDKNRPLALYDWRARNLDALRSGDWKLVFPHQYETVKSAGNNGKQGSYQFAPAPLALFNMKDDPGETNNVLEENPVIYERLRVMADAIRADLGDERTRTPAGPDVRPLGQGMLLPPPRRVPERTSA